MARAHIHRVADPIGVAVIEGIEGAHITAVRNGNIGDINLLLNAGARLDIADKYGHTPAHVAAIKAGIKKQKVSDHYIGILKLLKEKGADLDLKDYRGRSVEDCLMQFAEQKL